MFQTHKILFVLTGDLHKIATIGGAERQAILLAKKMIDNGLVVSVVVISQHKGSATDFLDSLGVPYCLYKRMITGKFINILNLIGIVQQIRKLKPDIVLSYTAPANIWTGLAAKFVSKKVRFIWGQRDTGMGLGLTRMVRPIIKQFSAFVSNSNEGVDFLEHTLKIEPAKIELIYNGIIVSNKKSSNKYRDLFKIEADQIVCTMVANIHHFKDHKTLIRAWGQVVSDRTTEMMPVLLIAGRKDDEFEPIDRLCQKLSITGSVKFLGSINDVDQLLSESDLLIHSSLTEGLPNSVLEAMAIGLPVLVTDIEGNKACLGVLASELNLTSIGDVEQMASKINSFIDNKQLREKEGKANKERIKQEFSLNKLYDKYMKLIDEISYENR